jgi:hypothetical protein
MDETKRVLTRIGTVTRALARHQVAVDALSDERDELVRQLRDAGKSFGWIAERTGLSRSRIAQICKRLV